MPCIKYTLFFWAEATGLNKDVKQDEEKHDNALNNTAWPHLSPDTASTRNCCKDTGLTQFTKGQPLLALFSVKAKGPSLPYLVSLFLWVDLCYRLGIHFPFHMQNILKQEIWKRRVSRRGPGKPLPHVLSHCYFRYTNHPSPWDCHLTFRFPLGAFSSIPVDQVSA